MMNQPYAADGGPVTPRIRRSSGNSVITNPYRGDQGRYPAVPYVSYESGPRSHSAAIEEIDNSCVVYVGGLTNMIDDRILYDTFRQFGSIVSLVRRSVNFDVRPNSTMTQYAFIGFSNSQDAHSAIQTGEITLDNRKLIIKPRDKPGVSYHKQINQGLHHHQLHKDLKEKSADESRDQILQLLHKNSRGVQPSEQTNAVYEQQQQQQDQLQHQQHEGQQQIQQQQSEQQMLTQAQSAQTDPITYFDGGASAPGVPGIKTSNPGQSPVLMSKALHVANLPIDMSPKELFTIFSEVGHIEGCYIFPYADTMNRRFGHLVMSTFYCAQKACEAFDGTIIRGCTLDVSYRPLSEADTGSPAMPFNSTYQHQMPQPLPQAYQPQFQQPLNFAGPMCHPVFQPQHPQMSWLPQPYGSPPGIMPPHGMIPFGHQFPPFQGMLPYPYNTMNPMSPPGFEIQPMHGPSPPNSPPFQNFQDPNSGWQGQFPNKPYSNGRQFVNRRPNGRGNRSFAPGRPSNNLPGNEPHVRSASDSSSTTLVSGGYDPVKYSGPVIVNGSYSSPVIVNGSYTSSCDTPSRNSFDGDTSDSDKNSTPSPVVARSVPDLKVAHETPTKPSSRATFEVLATSIIPETTEPADPANLFIKNLDDSVISDVEDLKLLFEPYGPVSSSFLATYPGSGISRGYGFVAFVKPEDAATAKSKLNSSMVGRKRVFVSYAERKEDRTQRLKGLFGGKGEDKKDKKAKDKLGETISEDGNSEISNIDTNTGNDEDTVDDSVVDTLSDDLPVTAPGGPLVDAENSTAEKVTKQLVEKTLEAGIPPIVAEQEITVTTRWRGTQLTGIAEVVEEEELSRIIANENSLSPSVGSSYIQPCIVQSPSSSVEDHEQSCDNIQVSHATVSQSPEQQNELIASLREVSPEISFNGGQQNNNDYRSAPQGSQQQQHANNSHNQFTSGNRNSGAYVQHQNQGYNGNGNGGGRPFYKNNNGNFGGERSRLPVPRYSNGIIQMAPGFTAPTGPRMPYFNNGNTQPTFTTFPNNEPLGQQHPGRKRNWKNSGNRRVRDNNPSAQQAKVQGHGVQMNGGMIGKAEMTATAF